MGDAPTVVAIVTILVVLFLVLVLVHLVILFFVSVIGIVFDEAERCADNRIEVRRYLFGTTQNKRLEGLRTRFATKMKFFRTLSSFSVKHQRKECKD